LPHIFDFWRYPGAPVKSDTPVGREVKEDPILINSLPVEGASTGNPPSTDI
jgi:hypothetical protein